jgi:TolB protein
MNVKKMEQRFHELKKQREAGKINDEQFTAEVEKLQFRDKQGQLWKIGASTGHWYHKKEGRWVRGEPPHEPKGPSKVTVIALLLAVGAFVLIIAGILAGPEWFPWLATPTAVVLATETATPSPMATPTPKPTDTPSPTATSTQVPTDTPPLTPTATVTLPTPTATVPLTPIPTDTPTLVLIDTPTATITTPILTDTPTPTPIPSVTGKIAFPVFDPERGTYDIFIANADGTGRKKLIKEEASQPCLSPGGTQIAYRSWRSDKRGLFMADISGNDLWTITTVHEASRPSVSEEGIAYYIRQAHIYLFRGKGEEPRVIRWGNQSQPLLGESPAWVSGKRLVYKGYVEGTGLYLTEGVYDRTGITRLTNDTNDTNPEVSPDGEKVAFMSRRDVNWEIYVMDLKSYTVERLTENAANDGLPIWSPDGQTIAFVSDRDGGKWAIWAMNPDGSNQRTLFPLPPGGSLHGYVWGAPQSSGWVEERLSWIP